MSKALYIGLMSGTSMDGIDCALVSIEDKKLTLIEACCTPYSEALLLSLRALASTPSISLPVLGQLNKQIAVEFANSVAALLKKTNIEASRITAIGSHGQTVFHSPPSVNGNDKTAFSMQLGDGSTLAKISQIDVIADFRQADIAVGGEGAPLAPVFHRAMFESAKTIGVLNLGGIANLSVLDKEEVIAFDTGPASTLMDAWIRQHKHCSYDDAGAWAASGSVDATLLQRLLQHPYFGEPAPKSTGFEMFNLTWLNQHLEAMTYTPSAENVQATLLELTAQSIAQACNSFALTACYACGGGVRNTHLMQRLAHLIDCKVSSSDCLGVDPNWMEAMCFAWLAHKHINGETANEPSVTGAKKKTILGAHFPAK